MKICMLSSVHSADDIRIVEKEARSLSEAGHDVTVVARSPRPSDPGRIEFKLIEVPPVARWKRPWVAGRAAIALARATGADVVQFHDPELIPFALLLKSRGCKVIYDVHEDVPADIYSKRWIPRWMQPIVAFGMELVERKTACRFDAIIAATPAIAQRFRDFGAAVTLVRNSVRLNEFIEPTDNAPRKRQAVYVGHVSFNRGLVEMVEACEAARLPLVLAGSIGVAEADWLKSVSSDVVHRGKLDRSEIATLLNESLIGLCLFHHEPNHLHAMPTKIFEYMAAGTAVITSDLPRSKEIVEAAGCGFSVSLDDKDELVERIALLAGEPERAIKVGQAGRVAVVRDYNWQHDAAELKNLYEKLAS
ncbi:glycosyltransferase family 4 protein [Bradyrhizobium elkanii]|uniref:Glycosyltransferase family 4 protein n=2 Tax=Nitrobacteraceae TaxID=41294 RepID=A0A4U6S2E3_BRAEL|nr:glycosyltransferase [Bradyrhizobium sp. BR2003]TKV81013.1 glycosyltransferase family 4 protein [Bradyrhizobium elkanii]